MISRYFLVRNGHFWPKMEPWSGHFRWEMDRFCQKLIVFCNKNVFGQNLMVHCSLKLTERNRPEFNRTRARPSRQPHTPVLHCWTHTVFKPYNPDYFLMIYGIDWNFVLILEIILRRKWREGWCMLIIT